MCSCAKPVKDYIISRYRCLGVEERNCIDRERWLWHPLHLGLNCCHTQLECCGWSSTNADVRSPALNNFPPQERFFFLILFLFSCPVDWWLKPSEYQSPRTQYIVLSTEKEKSVRLTCGARKCRRASGSSVDARGWANKLKDLSIHQDRLLSVRKITEVTSVF